MRTIKFILPLVLFSFTSLKAQSVLHLYEEGLRLLESGKSTEARERFSEVITLRPYYYDALVGRARTWLAEGRGEEALTDLSQALTVKPGWHEAHYYRGLYYYEQGQYRKATSDVEQCLADRPAYLPGILLNAAILESTGRMDEALRQLSAAVEDRHDRPDQALLIRRGLLLKRMGQEREAIKNLDQVIRMGSYPDSLLLIRAVLQRNTGNPEQAIADLSTYISRHPSEKDPRQLRARLLMEDSAYQQAMQDLDHLIDVLKIKDNADLYHLRGLALIRSGRPGDATGDLSRASALDRGNDEHILLRAEAYAAMGNENAALADYRRLIRLGSTDPRPWLARAKFYMDRKRWDLALDDLNEGIKAQSTAEGHYQRAICWYELKEEKKACADLRAAAELGHTEAARQIKSYCR